MSNEKTTEVTFKKSHRHGGVSYKKGGKTNVSERALEKLKNLGVI
jgi:hypothetical protein